MQVKVDEADGLKNLETRQLVSLDGARIEWWCRCCVKLVGG